MILIFILCLIFIARFGLAFSANAIDNYALTLRKSWSLTKGCGCRLGLGSFAVVTPVFLIFYGFHTLASRLFRYFSVPETGYGLQIFSSAMSSIFSAVMITFVAGFISYAYKKLFLGEGI
jgi:hypothetical protein